jgi:uracil-DNA glycosylase
MAGIYVPASGNPNAKLMILGESPSYAEEQALQPFVGPAGRELDRICKASGINRSDLWISNVSKYMIPFTDKKASIETRAHEAGINLQEQIDDLRREIQTINPNCILALGNTALHTLTGKQPLRNYRGSILSTWLGKKLVASYHPAHFLHQEKSESADYWERQVAIFDFKRTLHQSEFPEINLPSRNLHIARHSGDVYDFIHSGTDKLSIDIEANNCIPICIGLAFNKYEGLTVPLWNGISTSDVASTWIILARLLNNPMVKKIGQNFKYDQDKITRLGLPIDALYSDTMLKAFCINPELPKNLAFNTSIYTEEPFYKNEGMYEGSENDLFMGCARDACVTYEVDDAQEIDLQEMGLADYYHNFVMHLHPLYLDIENAGFLVDTNKRDELLRKYIAWDEKLRYDLYESIKLIKPDHPYINVNSWKQVGELLYDILKVPYRKGTGEEVLTSLLNNVIKPKDVLSRTTIENILESRRVRKTISNSLAALRDFDGRMRTTYFICLDTGRSSTAQQDPPIRPSQEIIEVDDNGKKKKKRKSLGSAFQTLTKHGDIGPDIRSMYVADEGEIFLQADSAQAEARVIFLLAEDYDALRDIDNCDYHALTASWFFGGTEKDYSKKELGYESPIRFAGKTLRHAGHLGAGEKRAAIETNTQARKYKINLTISKAQAAKALKIFHEKQPKIKQIFQASVIRCLEKSRKLIAPVPYGIDAKVGGTRIFYERWGDELFRQAFSYLPQRIVSENTKAAGLRIRMRAAWIKILVESHDALLVSIPIERQQEAAGILSEEFTRPIDFSTCSIPRGSLVIPCEIESGFNYYEMSKFKHLEVHIATVNQ